MSDKEFSHVISIPYGSIKRAALFGAEQEDLDFNSLWFN